jgi:hypothetical protein
MNRIVADVLGLSLLGILLAQPATAKPRNPFQNKSEAECHAWGDSCMQGCSDREREMSAAGKSFNMRARFLLDCNTRCADTEMACKQRAPQ